MIRDDWIQTIYDRLDRAGLERENYLEAVNWAYKFAESGLRGMTPGASRFSGDPLISWQDIHQGGRSCASMRYSTSGQAYDFYYSPDILVEQGFYSSARGLMARYFQATGDPYISSMTRFSEKFPEAVPIKRAIFRAIAYESHLDLDEWGLSRWKQWNEDAASPHG